MRAADWSRVPQRGHGVQFYKSDDQLLRLLTRYVGTALVGGDVALVVATRSHRHALDRRMAARGLDVKVARGEKRYLSYDATSVLDRFVRGGRVDVERARAEIDALLDRAGSVMHADGGPARVFVFGEMVMILCLRYGAAEAIRLEQVWNAAAAEHAFALCCAYPMGAFADRDAASFVRICGLHSHVFHAPDRRM